MTDLLVSVLAAAMVIAVFRDMNRLAAQERT